MRFEKPRIDTHCHFFSLDFLFEELIAMLKDGRTVFPQKIIQFKLPNKDDRPEKPISIKTDSILKLAKWFSQLWDSSTDTCEKNYLRLQSAYMGSFETRQTLITVPLMMDIYFMLDAVPESSKSGFQKKAEEIQNSVIETVWNSIRRSESPSDNHLKKLIKSAMDESDGTLHGCKMTPGFKMHLQELERLHNLYPDSVLPFLAVDPRRPGIAGLVEKMVGKKGPFFGVKLYPRLGYLPTHPDLDGILDFCQRYAIPIITHASAGGLPPTDDWIYEDYCNPAEWIPVLKKYPRLKVDFAHFGGKNIQWRESILNLIKQYPNVYTDVSCYTDTGRLEKVRDCLTENPILEKRLMFGTDYTVMLLTDFRDLNGYFDHFHPEKGKIFNAKTLDAMMVENPRRFLGIWGWKITMR